MDEYRISKSRDEIVKLVQKKFESENMMTIWQKDPKTETRTFKCDVKFYSLNHHEGTFSIAITQEQRQNFNSKLETYFLLKVQDFVFKTKIAITQPVNKEHINFQIPHDVRLKELRIHPRIYIESEEKRFVSARFESKDGQSLTIDVACPIYNISKTGICIIVSKETLSSIKMNEPINLEGLSFFDSMANEVKAIVKNARVYTKKGITTDEYYALGLEFKA
ncbi:MAG: hypothetical protein H7336_08875 [Bacteriovorax sp.]|nr:hypothetical protein [Bacteriovorax sp.]